MLIDRKTKKLTARSAPAPLDEPGERFASPFTHDVLTDFAPFHALLEAALGGDGRGARRLSLSATARAFEPLRAKANRFEYLFELFGFGAVREFRAGEGLLETGILIDLGHSRFSVAPLFAGRLLRPAFRSLPFGGKALTKLLQGALSATQFDLRGLFELAEDVKHRCCAVSPRALTAASLADCAAVGYALPDYAARRPGALIGAAERGRADALWLGAQRFVVPETIFHPRIAGLQSAGLAAAVAEAVAAAPRALRASLLANVVVTGGSAAFPGLERRLCDEIVAALPSDAKVCYRFLPGNGWFLERIERATVESAFEESVVSKAMYEEYGVYALIDFLSL